MSSSISRVVARFVEGLASTGAFDAGTGTIWWRFLRLVLRRLAFFFSCLCSSLFEAVGLCWSETAVFWASETAVLWRSELWLLELLWLLYGSKGGISESD